MSNLRFLSGYAMRLRCINVASAMAVDQLKNKPLIYVDDELW